MSGDPLGVLSAAVPSRDIHGHLAEDPAAPIDSPALNSASSRNNGAEAPNSRRGASPLVESTAAGSGGSEQAPLVNFGSGASLSQPVPAGGHSQIPGPSQVPGPWASALENLRGAEESRRALEELLSGDKALFVDERALRHVASAASTSQRLQAQQRRIDSLQQELKAAVTAAADAKAALRQSEQSRAVLQERLGQMEKELEATSGVFEVYTSELRARQQEVEKRCEEVRVLQGIVRNLNGAKEVRD